MKRNVTSLHLAEMASILLQFESMSLENRTWIVEIGQVEIDPTDIRAYVPVIVNGTVVGRASVEDVVKEDEE